MSLVSMKRGDFMDKDKKETPQKDVSCIGKHNTATTNNKPNKRIIEMILDFMLLKYL